MHLFTRIEQMLSERGIAFAGGCRPRSCDDLPPEEKVHIAAACDSRRQEFAAGRWCARLVLGKLGQAPAAIPAGDRGQPLWPAGVCGSIAHTMGAYCAAGALRARCRSVGIDIERSTRRITREMARLFLNQDEWRWIGADAAAPPRHFTRVFCAKESVYKLLFPLVKMPVSFSSLSVLPPTGPEGFVCRLNQALGSEFAQGALVEGAFVEDQTRLFAVASLPAGPGDAGPATA